MLGRNYSATSDKRAGSQTNQANLVLPWINPDTVADRPPVPTLHPGLSVIRINIIQTPWPAGPLRAEPARYEHLNDSQKRRFMMASTLRFAQILNGHWRKLHSFLCFLVVVAGLCLLVTSPGAGQA